MSTNLAQTTFEILVQKEELIKEGGKRLVLSVLKKLDIYLKEIESDVYIKSADLWSERLKDVRADLALVEKGSLTIYHEYLGRLRNRTSLLHCHLERRGIK